MRFLAEDPGLWAALKADPDLIGAGFEETLRVETPTQGFYRTATRDVDVDGVLVPARSRVLIQNASACRDERHYPGPDRFDIGRNPVDHLAFGYGIHSCTGQGLARIEARALIGSLLRRAGSIRLADEPVRHLHPTLRGLEHLPVAVAPARGV